MSTLTVHVINVIIKLQRKVRKRKEAAERARIEMKAAIVCQNFGRILLARRAAYKRKMYLSAVRLQAAARRAAARGTARGLRAVAAARAAAATASAWAAAAPGRPSSRVAARSRASAASAASHWRFSAGVQHGARATA